MLSSVQAKYIAEPFVIIEIMVVTNNLRHLPF